MVQAEYTFRTRYAMGDWCVYVKDPRGVPSGRYNGFDTQQEADEWAAQFVGALNTHHKKARGGR